MGRWLGGPITFIHKAQDILPPPPQIQAREEAHVRIIDLGTWWALQHLHSLNQDWTALSRSMPWLSQKLRLEGTTE